VAGLVVISAGFAEAGPEGAEAQRALVESVRAHGMRLVGPNSLGLLNTDPAVRLHATFAPVAPLAGRLGFSSQSGTLGVAILRHATRRGLGFSTVVGIGNRADLSTNDLLQYWEDDARTDVALLYVEAFGNPRKFTRLARRVSRRKPVVTVKHIPPTGATSGESALDALFLQSGVIRVETLQQLFDVAQVLVEQPLPAGPRVAVVGTAGTTGLAADACIGAGLELPALSASTASALVARLGPAVGHNPVGLSFQASPDDWERTLDAVLADEAVDAVLALLLAPLDGDAPDMARTFARVAGRTGKPVLATVLGGDDGAVEPAGVTVFAFPEAAATALGRVAAYAAWRRRPVGVVPALDGVDPEAAGRIVAAFLAGPEPARVGSAETLDLLAAYGISAAPLQEVRSAAEAGTAAARFGGPVAIKAQGLRRLGKVEEGGLSLDLQTPGDAVLAYDRMFRLLGDAMVPAVVQPMVPSGVDVLVAVHQDATFGPVLTLGAGGASADFGPRAVRVMPLTDLDVSDLVRSPRVAELLFDPDGGPVVDVTSLEDLLLRVGRLTEDLPEVVAVRLNPVIVSPGGATAVGVEVAVAAPVDRPVPVRRVG
jgi:acetate---CoA ligase (ADP-forming)